MLFVNELRDFKKFLHFLLVDCFKPFKTKSYLAQYQKYCEQIREEKSNTMFHYFQWTEIAMLIVPLNYFYNYFQDNKGDDIMINFDITGYVDFGNSFNLIVCAFCYWAIITFHKTYFTIEPIVLDGIKSIVQNDPKFLFNKPYIYKNHNLLKLLEKNIMFALNSTYAFCLFGSKCSLKLIHLKLTNFFLK